MDALESLTKALSRIPGLGLKSASRIAYYLLDRDQVLNEQLAQQIRELKNRIQYCSICGRFTETDPCAICNDPNRQRTVICVVERAKDVQNMEATGEYRGLYHVLGGVISPIDGIGPQQLRFQELFDRIEKEPCEEVIIATNPTVEGDTTALYLADELKSRKITVSRLASGLPVGGDLEYADRLTLARSLRGRIAISQHKTD